MVVLGAGEPGDRNYIPLATREGSIIRNERRLEAPPERMREGISQWQRLRPQARLRSATQTYDCMGMVFASRRTTVGTDQLRMILREDGYRWVSPDDLDVGDVVIYSRSEEATHVGIISCFKKTEFGDITLVLSKWGAYPEYEHPIDYVPEAYGKPVEYWTDRRPPL